VELSMVRMARLLVMMGLIAGVAGCQQKTKQADEMAMEQADENRLAELAPEDESEPVASEPAAEVPTRIEEPEARPAGPRIHVVRPKDTLYGLAREYYNDQRMWRRIWEANLDKIPDPNRINVGQELIIP